METDFLGSANHLFYIFIFCLVFYILRDPCWKNLFSLSTGNVFLNESFFPAIGEEFFSLMETVTLLESSFLLAETVTALWKPIFKDTAYSFWWKLIF